MILTEAAERPAVACSDLLDGWRAIISIFIGPSIPRSADQCETTISKKYDAHEYDTSLLPTTINESAVDEARPNEEARVLPANKSVNDENESRNTTEAVKNKRKNPSWLHHLTRMSSGAAGESERGLQWRCFHKFRLDIRAASGCLQR